MKHIAAVLLALLLCMGLWSCAKQETSGEEAVSAGNQARPEHSGPSEPSGEPGLTGPEEEETRYSEDQSPTDSSWAEIRRNAEGKLVSIYENPATGEYSEMEFSDDFKLRRSVSYNPATGRHSEVEYYENGKEKKAVSREEDFTSEQEYYENGNRKQIKTRTSKTAREMQYNEEGYCTYSHCADYREDGSIYYEIECFGDETGKLTKVIENGEQIADARFLADRINEYNFRS